MYRSIAALAGAALLLAGPAAIAQSPKAAPAVAPGPAPAVPWCPPGQAKDAVGKCVATPAPGEPRIVGQQTIDGRGVPVSVSTPTPAAKPPAEVPTVYKTLNGVRTAVAGPGAAPAAVPAKTSAKPTVGAALVPAAKPAAAPTTVTYAKPPAAGPVKPIAAPPPAKPARFDIAVGEPNGDCTARAPYLIHDSRSPGGCAPCPRGRVPNTARQACVIPIPRRP